MTAGLTLRKVFRSPPFAAAQRLIPEDAIDLIRRKFFPMTQHEAIRVLGGLLAAEVPFVLAGGWAVDALVAKLRRRHSDIDVIVPPESLPLVTSTLADLGYALSSGGVEGGWWAPDKTVFRSTSGGSIEVLLLTVEQLDPLVQRAQTMLARPVSRTPAVGQIAGVEVPCLSAALQLASHDGYTMNHDQRGDRHVLEVLAGDERTD